MATVPMALALFTFQTAAATVNVSDLARGYLREGEADEGAAVFDLENTPRLELGLDWPTTALSAEYAPRLLWLDVFGEDPSGTLLLHNAALRLSWRQPRYSLWVAQTASIGDQNFSRLGSGGSVAPQAVAPMPGSTPTAPPDLDLAPTPEVVAVLAEETSVGLRHDWTRRWISEFEVAFGISGGADAEAQVYLPQQRTARFDTALDHRLGPRDTLSTGLDVSQIHTSNGYDHWIGTLTETWSTLWTTESGVELGGGLALADTHGPGVMKSTHWVPVVTASVWHLLPVHTMELRLQADAGYRPDVNVVAGTLQKRFFTTAQGALLIDATSIRLTFGASQTFPRSAVDAADVTNADLSFEHLLVEWLSLQYGGQLLYQSFAGSEALAETDWRWLVYAGLQFRLPEAQL